MLMSFHASLMPKVSTPRTLMSCSMDALSCAWEDKAEHEMFGPDKLALPRVKAPTVLGDFLDL